VREEFLSGGSLIHLEYDMPLAELISDFFDKIKSVSSGYASLDYEHKCFQISDIKSVVFHLNGEPVDALTFLVHDSRAISFARQYCQRLKDLLPA